VCGKLFSWFPVIWVEGFFTQGFLVDDKRFVFSGLELFVSNDGVENLELTLLVRMTRRDESNSLQPVWKIL
jgi:hypothetical protein